MKNLILIVSLLFLLTGCSSLEVEPLSSSGEEAQRILALGLSHEENLKEARKIDSAHKSAVVIGLLKQAENDKIQSQIDMAESAKYSESVQISNNNSMFTAQEVVNSKTVGLLLNPDVEKYFIQGVKDLSSGEIKHEMYISIGYTSTEKRVYSSANLCDKWQGCSDGEEIKLRLVSNSASSCTSDFCDYLEEMKLELSDSLLKSGLKEGITVRFNSKKEKNKISIPSFYVAGYLDVINKNAN